MSKSTIVETKVTVLHIGVYWGYITKICLCFWDTITLGGQQTRKTLAQLMHTKDIVASPSHENKTIQRQQFRQLGRLV